MEAPLQQQQHPLAGGKLCGELLDLLHKAAASPATSHPVPRALDIISVLPAEQLYALMLALARGGNAAAAASAAGLNGVAAAPAGKQGGRRSLAVPAELQLPGAASTGEDPAGDDEPPDSPRRFSSRQHNSSSSDQQQAVHLGAAAATTPGSGRCFLAESLELTTTLSESCDWSSLAQASLADFSAAAAAARASRTGLLGPSIAQPPRALSPVAEGSSLASAVCDPTEDRPRSAWGNQQQQQQHEQQALEHGDDDDDRLSGAGIPSTCSSPREQQQQQASGSAPRKALAAVRQSAADSALDWPRALPVRVDAFTLDAASPASSAAPSPAAAYHHHHHGAVDAAAQQQQYEAAAAAGQAVFAQLREHSGTSNASSNDTSSSGARRNPGGVLGRALLAPVNALRRSLTGGRGLAAAAAGKGSIASQGQQRALPKAPQAASAACRPLARGSAPVAAVYAQRAAASPVSLHQHSLSPAYNSRLASFSVTHAAASAASSPGKAAPARGGVSTRQGGWAGSGSGSKPTGNVSYRPPSAAGSASDSPAPASGSRLPPSPASGPGLIRAQLTAAHLNRPSSACAVADLRADLRSCQAPRSAAGSCTSGGGAIPSFQATKQMLQHGTPLARPHNARGAVAAAARANVRQAGAGSAVGGGSRIPSRLPTATTPPSIGAGSSSLGRPKQQHSVVSVFAGAAAATQGSCIGGGARAGGSGSRIGRGSQLRRSRSCGSLADLLPAAGAAKHHHVDMLTVEHGLPQLGVCLSPTKDPKAAQAGHPQADDGGGVKASLFSHMDSLITKAAAAAAQAEAAATCSPSTARFAARPGSAGGGRPSWAPLPPSSPSPAGQQLPHPTACKLAAGDSSINRQLFQ